MEKINNSYKIKSTRDFFMWFNRISNIWNVDWLSFYANQ